MDNTYAVRTENLSKNFAGLAALTDVNLHVPEGSVYGLIGGNGAGKTTTIKILLGLIAASSGTAQVLGHERGTLPAAPVPGVAYLPDVPTLPGWMSAPQALEFFGEVSGVERAVARRRAANLLELVGLTRAPGNIGGFSRGMTQRLGIALALVGAPRLLVLDEPTSALDPLGRADVLNIIRELSGRTTVLLTSHLLADVQQVCDHVGMLHEGTLLAEGPLDEVLAVYRPERATVQVSVARADTAAARSAIAAACGAAGVEAQLDIAPPSLQHVYEYLSRGRVSQ